MNSNRCTLYYFVQVDYCESIGLPHTHVGDTEVEPLRVLVGVEVIAEVQLIVPPPTAKMEMRESTIITSG